MRIVSRRTLHAARCAVVFLTLPVAAQSPSRLELGVLAETNAARTNPAAYAQHLEQRLGWFDGYVIRQPGVRVGIRTQEGPAAVREAIGFLRRQRPLPPLEWSAGIARAARDHALDQGPGGLTGHEGRDGSRMGDRMNRYGRWQGTAGENIDYGSDDPRDVLISLIVDDGVPSRGHRENIFSAAFGVAGVGCAPHAQYGHMCVIDYAASYQEGGAASPRTTQPARRAPPPVPKPWERLRR